MKIKQKIIVGTLSIVTVLGFGVQLPVSATGNRPGVFQEQFFPDEHNIADELWAKAERTDTAEDWEAAAEACDKAHKAYEKSGNMEIAREFFANTYKAAAKSSQKVAEKISYNLSSFSAEELEKKRDQAINNWNLAAECYEEAARLFRNTEARDDEDKICEKLAKEVRANADFDTALAAWEKANKVNTVESWNNAGQLFDQAAQSCRDAGFIEKSSSCDNKSREAFKKIESIKKSSIDTDLEEDTNVANQTEQVVVENEKVDETSEEAFLKQVENIITEVKNKRLNSKEVTRIDTDTNDRALDCINQISLMNNEKSNKQAYIRAAWEEAKKQPTIEKWNELAKRYEELAEDYKKAGDEKEANKCLVESKQAYSNVAVVQKDWNKVAEINKELAEEYKTAGDEKEANICILNFKQAYIHVDWKEVKKRPTVEKWNELAKSYEKLAEEYKTAGDEQDANMCILNSKRAYFNVAMAKKDWNKIAKINKEFAEEYKKAGDEKKANICILDSKQAYIRVAWKEVKEQHAVEKWNEVAKRYEELAENYKKAGVEKGANICILNSKQAYNNADWKETEKQPTIEKWNEVAKRYEELAENYKKAGVEKETNICILKSKQAYNNADWKETEKQPTIEKWNEVAKRYEELAEDYKKAGDEKESNICILKSKQAYVYAALKEARNEFTAESWNEVSKCYSEVAEACEKMADGESDVNEANSYRAMAKEYMEKANMYKQYAQILAKLTKDI